MNYFELTKQLLLSTVVGLASFSAFADGAVVSPLMEKTLHCLDNKEGVMLTVEYVPGASSKSHRHGAHAFFYVLEGTITMQVLGSEPVMVAAGKSFYESPKDIHLVSKNANAIEAEKFGQARRGKRINLS